MNILIDTRFKYAITAFDIFMPVFFTGVILSSMLIYFILFIKIKKRAYLYILIFFLFFVTYNIFNIIALIYGAVEDDVFRALSANRLSIVSLMLMFIFLSLYNFADLIPSKNTRKHFYKANLVLFIATTSLLSFFIIIYFFKPDIFISINKYSAQALDFTYQYARSAGYSYFLYKVFLYFILFFIGINTLFVMLRIATDEKQNKSTFVFLFFKLLSFLFMYEYITSKFMVLKNYHFNRMSLSLFLLVVPYILILFDSFLRDAIKIIKKQDIKNNDIIINSKKINTFQKKTKKIDTISRTIKNKSNIIIEMLKENTDAFDITEKKIKNLDIYSYCSMSDISKNIEDLARSLENTFDTFNNTRLQIDERCRFLFNLIEDSEKLSNANSDIQYIVKNLSSTSKNLEIETAMTFKQIYQSISDFSNFDTITKAINETAIALKNITNNTNILSINASIHASKAGVLGHGFSIVAKEIGVIAIENSKLSENIEVVLKNIFNSIISIDSSNKNIKIELQLLEEYIHLTKENIDSLIINLEEYINISIDSRKLLREINIKGLSIDNIRKQQDSIVMSVQKNVSSLIALESDINKNICKQKNIIMDIVETSSDINNIKNELSKYSDDIKNNAKSMAEKCGRIDNIFNKYEGGNL